MPLRLPDNVPLPHGETVPLVVTDNVPHAVAEPEAEAEAQALLQPLPEKDGL